VDPGDSGQARDGDEEPRGHRDEVEHADEIVERGVIRALLVPVVEVVELRQENPARQRGGEEKRLARGPEPVSRAAAGAERDLREDERGGETGEVAGEQQAADDPPAAPRDLRPAPEPVREPRLPGERGSSRHLPCGSRCAVAAEPLVVSCR
jgi:hypothetical protein